MATYYYGLGGDNSNDGLTPATAWLTLASALTQSTTNDTLIALDGVTLNQTGSDPWVASADREYKTQSYRGTEILSQDATYCARTSSILTAAMGDIVIDGYVFNGRDISNDTFSVERASGEDVTNYFNNCVFKNGVNYTILNRMRRGTQKFVNCKFEGGTGLTSIYENPDQASNDGDQVIEFDGCEVQGTFDNAGTHGVYVQKVDNLTNTLSVSLKGLHGKCETTGDIGSYFLRLNGIVAPEVSNFNIAVKGEATSNSVYGIYIQSKATAKTTGFDVQGGFIDFDAPSGFAFYAVSDLAAVGGTTGTISGVEITGRYFASATPHLFSAAEDSNITMKGNKAYDGYVGYLIAETVTNTTTGNLAFDCYGPSYYVKGAVDCTITDNTAIVTRKYTQRDVGIISVTNQGAADTAAATITDNVIIVEDVSKIHSILQTTDSNQVATFGDNTIIIPDTVDVSTALLFAYQSASPNNTLAQWNTNNGTTDRIVQLPLKELRKKIKEIQGNQTSYISCNSYTSRDDIVITGRGNTLDDVAIYVRDDVPEVDAVAAIERAKTTYTERTS